MVPIRLTESHQRINNENFIEVRSQCKGHASLESFLGRDRWARYVRTDIAHTKNVTLDFSLWLWEEGSFDIRFRRGQGGVALPDFDRGHFSIQSFERYLNGTPLKTGLQ